jgi:hypothetical protein
MTRSIRTFALLALLSTGSVLDGSDAPAQEAPPQPAPLCGRLRTPLIDDFESGAANHAWFTFNDGTGEQTPADGLDLIVRGGPKKSRFAIHTAGDEFVEWGAGVGVALGCGYDVRAFDGMSFAVRADGAGSFELELLTYPTWPVEFGGECTGDGCNDHYMLPMSLPDDRWYQCSVRFDDLAQQGFGTPVPLDLQSVGGVQYGFFGPDMPFDFALDDVQFVKRIPRTGCVPLEPEKSCGGGQGPSRGR